MPGLVGLAILDSFSMYTPMITTKYPFHSPEIEYLINRKNGLICENSLRKYVDVVVDFFQNKNLQNELNEGCNESFKKYTVQNMVTNFAAGIIKAVSK